MYQFDAVNWSCGDILAVLSVQKLYVGVYGWNPIWYITCLVLKRYVWSCTHAVLICFCFRYLKLGYGVPKWQGRGGHTRTLTAVTYTDKRFWGSWKTLWIMIYCNNLLDNFHICDVFSAFIMFQAICMMTCYCFAGYTERACRWHKIFFSNGW